MNRGGQPATDMSNRDLTVTWKYHNATKHSYASVRSNPHMLDWANKPLEYKLYPTLEITRLSNESRPTGIPGLAAIDSSKISSSTEAVLNLDALAQILYLSAGITKSKKFPGGELFFRAAACTGALYEIELYIVCGDLPGLAAGVYHFGVAEFGLRQLRAGDFRRTLAEFAGKDSAVLRAPATIVCSGTYWRNAWKYQSRAYRHFGWDNGTILANTLAVASALRLPAKVLLGFMDAPLGEFLGLDPKREVAFSLVTIGNSKSKPAAAPEYPPLQLPLIQNSKVEVDYPLMREMHAASSLKTKEEVSEWKDETFVDRMPPAKSKLVSLPRMADDDFPPDPIEKVIARRGSTRSFAQVPISLNELSILLDRVTRPLPADFLDPHGSFLNGLYMIVNDVENLPSGAYVYHREQHALEHLRQGNFRKMAGYLALEQELAATASIDIFFLADLKAIVEQFGNRGYRAAQLEAGISGGRLYLSAYAQRLGATGLTFYDDDVVRFFSPHAEGKSAIFLVAIGRSQQSNRPKKTDSTGV